MPKYKRRIKLIRPRLQLKLTGWFLSVTVMGLLLQYLLFGYFLTQLALQLPAQGGYLIAEADSMLLKALGFSLLLVLPLALAVGILVTFRVAGPVYRFEDHLGRIARGEAVGPCRIRQDDELQELCRLLNQAIEALDERARRAGAAGVGGATESPAVGLTQPGAALPEESSRDAQRLA